MRAEPPRPTPRLSTGPVRTDAAAYERTLPWLLLLGGDPGTVAAFALTVERIALLRDRSYVPSCSLNPVLSCGSVMETGQAEVFGFPNPLLGLVAFPVVAATGAALLAGARMRRWYWLGLQAGVTFGVGFVGWLVFQSLYRIKALCPCCMVVWAVVVPTFWYVTLATCTAGTSAAAPATAGSPPPSARNYAVVLTLAVLVVLALITQRFWDYWSTLV